MTVAERVEFPSGTYDPNDSKAKALIVEGKGLPRGRLFQVNNLRRSDFGANSDEGYEKACAQLDKAKKAESRKKAQGLIFIDRCEVKCDNQKKPMIAYAKLKVLGTMGNMRIFFRKETVGDKTLYVAEGVKKRAHDKRV